VIEAHQALRDCEVPGEILVVDNGSHDRSARLAALAGARIVHAERQGYGFALRRGFEAAQFSELVMVDADLSYPMNQIPRLYSAFNHGFDFILGNRLQGRIEPKAMPLLNRYVGTPALSVLLRKLHSIPTYDCNSGLRLFRRADVWAMNLQSGGMELASEMLVRAAQMNLRYHEVVIPFFRDQRGHRSHLNRWHDGLRHLRLICNGKFDSRQTGASDQNPKQNAVNERVKADLF
jgi:glycosyltransferase involved in cell wall biosynthesis